MAHFFPLEVSFKSIYEKTVMWDGKPVEDLLLFLSSDALIFE